MKYSIVYSSLTGNTKMLADVVKNHLNKDDCIYFGEPCEKALEAELIYCGFWTDKGMCDDKTQAFLKKLNNQYLFLFGTAGFKSSGYYEKIIDSCKSILSKNVLLIGSFMCQGKMGEGVKQRYLKLLEIPEMKERAEISLKNFDEALKHPNEQDFEELKSKLIF